MIEVDRSLPMIYNGNSNLIIESMKFYFKEKWLTDLYKNLENGYSVMSQINLTLAEIGLEQDMRDLSMYEARLLGSEML